MVFNFLKRNKEEVSSADPVAEAPGVFSRLKSGLRRTRSHFASGVATLFLGKKHIDDDLLEELEAHLLSADVGVAVTDGILKEITQQMARKQLSDPNALLEHLKDYLHNELQCHSEPLTFGCPTGPQVILVVGVNGSGKTTTIGKLAKHVQQQGHSVLLAAGDTFRAAAVEQLKVWGERNEVPVVAQGSGADSAAVIYDAIVSAKAKGIDVVIADTAGRLHTQSHLMEELKKVVRVIKKVDETAPHEVLLVLDAGIGQNAVIQAEQFSQAVGVSGIALTKLDGTAKGGVIFAIAQALQLPIRFIGVGEGVDDLQCFDAKAFVAALFETEGTIEHV